MLIILINSFLHFQVSNELIQNFAISSSLHSVISHFCDLGPVARLYLLKMKTLNRLLKIVVQNRLPSQDVETMSDLVPLYQIAFNKNSGLYLMPNMMQGLNYKLINSERAKQSQAAQSPMLFLIKTIQSLVRSCQFVNQGTDEGKPASTQTSNNLGPFYNGITTG